VATSGDELTVWINHWHRMACCQRDELVGATIEEWIVAYDECTTPCWTRRAKAASISRSVPALTTRICCPVARPAG
jgi:hypothetical protein